MMVHDAVQGVRDAFKLGDCAPWQSRLCWRFEALLALKGHLANETVLVLMGHATCMEEAEICPDDSEENRELWELFDWEEVEGLFVLPSEATLFSMARG